MNWLWLAIIYFRFWKWIKKAYKSYSVCAELNFLKGRGCLWLISLKLSTLHVISHFILQTLQDQVKKAKMLAEDDALNKHKLLSFWCSVSGSCHYTMLSTYHVGWSHTYVMWKYPHDRFNLPFFFASLCLPSKKSEEGGDIFVLVHYHWSSSSKNYSLKMNSHFSQQCQVVVDPGLAS